MGEGGILAPKRRATAAHGTASSPHTPLAAQARNLPDPSLADEDVAEEVAEVGITMAEHTT